jgi:acyl-CoA thioester hydrolase
MKIYLSTGKVKKEWTDYNGHMNLAFYIHLFDTGWEVMLINLTWENKRLKVNLKQHLQ